MAIQTTERMLEYILPAGQYSIIDCFWGLSQINRRSYRQGYELAFDKIEIFQTDPAEQATVMISRLPNTWVTVNAWTKAYHNWKDQQDDALAEGDLWSRAARYRDFKVCYNHGHASGTFNGITVNTPIPSGAISLADALLSDSGARMDWEYSEFVVPNITSGVSEEFLGFMLGDDATPGKGLIHAYAESRSRPHPEDPSTVAPTGSGTPGGLYTAMHDVGEDLEDIIYNVEERNHAPPYVVGGVDSAVEFYPGGALVDLGGHGVTFDTLIVRASSLMSTDSTGPCTALLGLLWLHNDGNEDTTVRIWCSPGPYKGVMARPMQEAN